MNEGSINREEFSFDLPFDITLDPRYDIDSVKSDIEDFYYDVINEDTLTDDFYYFSIGESIVKHSKHLTDLIENKDVLKVRIDKTIIVFGMDEDTSDIKYKQLIENIENGEYELLEILTHEQFEANCYKVGGEDE